MSWMSKNELVSLDDLEPWTFVSLSREPEWKFQKMTKYSNLSSSTCFICSYKCPNMWNNKIFTLSTKIGNFGKIDQSIGEVQIWLVGLFFTDINQSINIRWMIPSMLWNPCITSNSNQSSKIQSEIKFSLNNIETICNFHYLTYATKHPYFLRISWGCNF